MTYNLKKSYYFTINSIRYIKTNNYKLHIKKQKKKKQVNYVIKSTEIESLQLNIKKSTNLQKGSMGIAVNEAKICLNSN